MITCAVVLVNVQAACLAALVCCRRRERAASKRRRFLNCLEKALEIPVA